ncbi:MAG TPA: hypothetical protein VGF95_05450 [Solirubrobacteraceae bacterium]|jgi:hypothetical protein
MRRSSIFLCIIALFAFAGSVGVQSALGAELSTGPSLNNYLESEPEGNAEAELTEQEEEANEHAKSSSSKGPSVLVIGVIAAVVLLFGIAFLIVRDARKVAPVAEGPAGGGMTAEARAAAVRKRRSKAKAARQQRKRNQQRSR